MSERIVIALQCPIDGPPQVYLLEPNRHADASRPMDLDMDVIWSMMERAGVSMPPRSRYRPARSRARAPTPAPVPGAAHPSKRKRSPDSMMRAGKVLFRKLSAHPAFRESVEPLLRPHPNLEEPFYLYFEHRMQELEELPWEALFAPYVGFLSHDRDFGIGRMLNSNSTRSEWLFEPPLKIAAVLGAGGRETEKIGGRTQWEKLRDAVKGSRLPVQLRVLTCQQDLRDEINRTGALRPLPPGMQAWVTADLIQDRDQLFAEIREFAPHILHFFCHGIAATRPQLQVASFKDWATDEPGSILIEGEQLRQNADPDGNIWLVTLNCCETARQGMSRNGSLSMPVACNLVSGGIPVAVGMRERIDNRFADKFCGLFYEALLAELRRRVDDAQDRGVADIHWACGLFRVRESMYNDLKSSGDWTIPVMHTRLKPFQLKLNPARGIPVTSPADPVPSPGTRPGLTANAIHEYGQELRQLAEDRKLFEEFREIVRCIDQRIDEINAILRS